MILNHLDFLYTMSGNYVLHDLVAILNILFFIFIYLYVFLFLIGQKISPEPNVLIPAGTGFPIPNVLKPVLYMIVKNYRFGNVTPILDPNPPRDSDYN